MKKVLRPVKQPPILHKYDTFSAEAQKTFVALEVKYSRLLKQLQPQNYPQLDPSEYYRSIYDASFRNNGNCLSNLNSTKNVSHQNQISSFSKTDSTFNFDKANLSYCSKFCLPTHDEVDTAHQQEMNMMFKKHEFEELDPAQKVFPSSSPSDKEIMESILSLTQESYNPNSPSMDLEENFGLDECSSEATFLQKSGVVNKSITGKILDIPSADKSISQRIVSKLTKKNLWNSAEIGLGKAIRNKYFRQSSQELALKTQTITNTNSVRSPAVETLYHNNSVPCHFGTQQTESNTWLRCDTYDEIQKPQRVTTGADPTPEYNSQFTASPAVNFKLDLMDVSLSQGSDNSFKHQKYSQEPNWNNSISVLSHSRSAKETSHTRLIENTEVETVSLQLSNKVSSTSPTISEPDLKSNIHLTSNSKGPKDTSLSKRETASVKRNHEISHLNTETVLYDEESPLGIGSKMSSKKPRGNGTVAIKRQRKISDFLSHKSDESKKKTSSGTISTEREDSGHDSSQTRKSKTRFKPPNKVVSTIAFPSRGFNANGQSTSSDQKEISFTSLSRTQQKATLDLLLSSDCLYLTILYNSNLGSVNDFYSSSDNAKSRILGIVVLAEDPDEKCFHIPANFLSRSDIRAALLNILATKTCTKIITNCKEFLKGIYEVLATDSKHGFQCENVEDPVIASWLVNPEIQPSTFSDMCRTANLQHIEDEKDWLPCLHFTSQIMQALRSRLMQEKLWPLFKDIEMRLVPLLALMEKQSIRIDMEKLMTYSNVLKSKMEKIQEAVYKEAGHEFVLNSHAQLRQVLYEELQLDKKLPPKAKIGKTGVGNLKSTDESNLNRLKDIHAIPALVLEYRQLQKLKSTYVDGIISCVTNHHLSTHWDQTAAATGRLTSYGPNVQAVPKTNITVTDYEKNYVIGSAKSSEIDINAREPFVSNEGWLFLAADFQQIELRIVASLSGDTSLLSLFWQSEAKDIFISLASQWHHKPAESVTFEDREQTKRVVYSVLYGVGKEKLSEYLKVTPDVAKDIMKSFLLQFPSIASFTKKCWDYAREFGHTETLCGRRRYFPHINSPSPVLRAQTERQAVNFCVQGSAADICKLAMLAVADKLREHNHLSCRLLLHIHDELVWEVPKDQLIETKDLIQGVMEDTKALCGKFCALQVPLTVVLSSGTSLAQLTPCVGAESYII